MLPTRSDEKESTVEKEFKTNPNSPQITIKKSLSSDLAFKSGINLSIALLVAIDRLTETTYQIWLPVAHGNYFRISITHH